jgi:quercetin dioxygenase-like cupin family protein
MRVLLSLAALIFLALSAAAFAQDPVVADADHIKLVTENDQVRVLRYSYKPGDKSPVHDHAANVIVAFSNVDAKSTVEGKTTDIHMKAGDAIWRGPTKHIFENTGSAPAEGFLVEPKCKPAGAVQLPQPETVAKVVAENDQVRVLHFTYGPGAKSEMHSHPDNVSIPLADSHLRVTSGEGKTTETTGKAGDARYRPALKHAVENIGDKAYEGIIVELKCKSAETKAGN